MKTSGWPLIGCLVGCFFPSGWLGCCSVWLEFGGFLSSLLHPKVKKLYFQFIKTTFFAHYISGYTINLHQIIEVILARTLPAISNMVCLWYTSLVYNTYNQISIKVMQFMNLKYAHLHIKKNTIHLVFVF